MAYEVLIIKTTGDIIRSTQPKAPTYEQQTAAVGGFIETVPCFTKVDHLSRGTAYVNEEGWLHGLPINLRAMDLWRKSCPKGDPERMILCGDVIFFAKQKTNTVCSGCGRKFGNRFFVCPQCVHWDDQKKAGAS